MSEDFKKNLIHGGNPATPPLGENIDRCIIFVASHAGTCICDQVIKVETGIMGTVLCHITMWSMVSMLINTYLIKFYIWTVCTKMNTVGGIIR